MLTEADEDASTSGAHTFAVVIVEHRIVDPNAPIGSQNAQHDRELVVVSGHRSTLSSLLARVAPGGRTCSEREMERVERWKNGSTKSRLH